MRCIWKIWSWDCERKHPPDSWMKTTISSSLLWDHEQTCGAKDDILHKQINWISCVVHLSVLLRDKDTFPLMHECQWKNNIQPERLTAHKRIYCVPAQMYPRKRRIWESAALAAERRLHCTDSPFLSPEADNAWNTAADQKLKVVHQPCSPSTCAHSLAL